MKIMITSKKYDTKTGVSTTRERGFAVADIGKCLRHLLLDEENEYDGAVADASRMLSVPRRRLRAELAGCVLDMLDGLEQKGEYAIEISIGDKEGSHDIDA